jgi:hypothetical protein
MACNSIEFCVTKWLFRRKPHEYCSFKKRPVPVGHSLYCYGPLGECSEWWCSALSLFRPCCRAVSFPPDGEQIVTETCIGHCIAEYTKQKDVIKYNTTRVAWHRVHDTKAVMRVLILAANFFFFLGGGAEGGRKSAMVHTSQPPPKFIWVKFKYMVVHISVTYISFLFRNTYPRSSYGFSTVP